MKLPDTIDIDMRGLPAFCAARHPTTRQPVGIERDVMGFSPLSEAFDPTAFNKLYGITAAMREAMICGSMFGWHVPGALPSAHTDANYGDEC